MVWPNGGETVVSGSATPVIWSKSASVPLVDVDLSHDGGTTWRRLATGVSGTARLWLAIPPGTAAAVARVSAAGTPSVADSSDLPFTVAGPGAAGTLDVGPGCGPGAQPPLLVFGTPRLGQTVTVDITGATPLAPGGIVASLVPSAPVAVGPGCSAYLDPGSVIVAGGFITNSFGDATALLQIPGIVGLAGSVIRAQALALPSSGLELTNGIELTLGF
jgi:hypothetical protein